MRTLSTYAAREAARVTGAWPRIIVEVHWTPSTPTYYAGSALTFPVTAEARLVTVGDITNDAVPRQVGGASQVAIELEDSDGAILTAMGGEGKSQGTKVWVHLWFGGNVDSFPNDDPVWEWDTDKVTLFGGTIAAPVEWSINQATRKFTVRSFADFFNKHLGLLMSQDRFPDCDPQQAVGQMIPVVFGDPCYRVPAYVIDRPGMTYTKETILFPQDTMTVVSSAVNGHFTVGDIDLIVGYPGMWERIGVNVANDDATEWTIRSRGCAWAGGTLNGKYSQSGTWYLMVAESDLPTDSGGALLNLQGSPLYLKDMSGNWLTYQVTLWNDQGASKLVAVDPPDASIDPYAPYYIGGRGGLSGIWPPGTPVYEVADWVYVCNFGPSTAVTRVEARTEIEVAPGKTQEMWVTFHEDSYTEDLDDTGWQTELSRSDSRGITTITLSQPPQVHGFSSEAIWVTLDGWVDDDVAASDPSALVSNPAQMIEVLLTDGLLGNLDGATYVNAASFTAAKNSFNVAEGGTARPFACSIQDSEKEIMSFIGEMAYQAGCLVFWDQGQLFLSVLSTDTDDESVTLAMTLTENNIQDGSLTIKDMDSKAVVSELIGEFQPTSVSGTVKVIRRSDDAEAIAGTRRETTDLWAIQHPDSADAAVEQWIKILISRNVEISCTLFLDALALQPGDIVRFNVAHAGTNVFDKRARIKSVRHTLGDARSNRVDTIQITCEAKLYDWAMVDATADTMAEVETSDTEYAQLSTHVPPAVGSRRLPVRYGAGGSTPSVVVSRGDLEAMGVGGAGLRKSLMTAPAPETDPQYGRGSLEPEDWPNDPMTGGGKLYLARCTTEMSLASGGVATSRVSSWDLSTRSWSTTDYYVPAQESLGLTSSIGTGQNLICLGDPVSGLWIPVAIEC